MNKMNKMNKSVMQVGQNRINENNNYSNDVSNEGDVHLFDIHSLINSGINKGWFKKINIKGFDIDFKIDTDSSRRFLSIHNDSYQFEKVCDQAPLSCIIATFGDSKILTLQIFRSLELRLTKNEELRRQVVDFMRDYQTAGHMEFVS